MSLSLASAITAVGTKLESLTGMDVVFTDPPESISVSPCAVVYPQSGELRGISSGVEKTFHTIRADCMVLRQQLPLAVGSTTAWADELRALLAADEQLGGACGGIVWPVRYSTLALDYANTIFYCVRFDIQIWMIT